jgi:hypothetical protein
MGLAKDDLVLEVGHDSDCDSTLRDELMSITGTTFLKGSTSEVVDAVIIWWREGDGDLVDELMDGLTYLVENGAIWVMTPKAGRAGHVEPSDIQDAAPIAGLSVTSTIALAKDWTATRLVARKAGKR